MSDYPLRDDVYYGRAVWPLGEDGDAGVLIEGHGRPALAALNAHERAQRGHPRWAVVDGRPAPDEKWATFAETCGHTPEQHAKHLHFVDGPPPEGECDCEYPGLPPCDPDRFAWAYRLVAAGSPGAAAVTEVIW